MTKLEQVARALFEKASEDRPIYDRVSWEEIGPTGKEHFMGAARVAVETLRDECMALPLVAEYNIAPESLKKLFDKVLE